jgi:hypothetical protein
MTMRSADVRWAVCAAVVACAVLTVGCREAEQNRPLEFEPHVYRGEKLAPLTDQQRRELQERGELQR